MIEPHRIAGQFFNRPLLLTPQAAKTISSFLLSRFDARRGTSGESDAGISSQAFAPTIAQDGKTAEFHSPRTSRFYGEYRVDPDGRPTPYRVTSDGTAIIPIIGELVNRGAWIGASSGLVSYEGIKFSMLKAGQDPQVSAILLDIESPGGEAVGAFETSAVIRKVAAEKPVLAFVNGMAASAGYAIASGANRIITIPSGITGSIGVVMMHLDVSEYLALEGVKPTLIFAGSHKVDGNPYEPLPEDVRARFQAEIDTFYGLFVQSVAQGRGRALTAQQARQTEARVFMGDDAVRLGLADEVGSFDEVMAELAAPRSRSATLGRAATALSGRTITMSDQINADRSSEVAAALDAADPGIDAGAASSQRADAEKVEKQSVSPAGIEEAGMQTDLTAHHGTPALPGAAHPDAELAATAERERAVAINLLAAQANRLGVPFDAVAAISEGATLDALRASVLDAAADHDVATAVISHSANAPLTGGDPLLRQGGGLAAAAEKRRTDLLARAR